MRGEMNADRETQVIQNIVRHGIEREELRDEIIIQCMRQVFVFSINIFPSSS